MDLWDSARDLEPQYDVGDWVEVDFSLEDHAGVKQRIHQLAQIKSITQDSDEGSVRYGINLGEELEILFLPASSIVGKSSGGIQ